MAKKIKLEEPAENEEIIKTDDPAPPEEQEYVYIPDIPAQAKEENTVVHTDVVETEVNFLRRILYIQESGGFGSHLNKLINDRIKSLV